MSKREWMSASAAEFAVSETRGSTRRNRDVWRMDRERPTVVFDIDGTLVDISARLALAPGRGGRRSGSDWDTVLSGKYYSLDSAIPCALAYARHCAREWGWNVVYLSGRRSDTVGCTVESLSKMGFPDGWVIHRCKGYDSARFKQEELRALSGLLPCVAYFGDRLWDDCAQAAMAGVRPILVTANHWVHSECTPWC